MLAPQLKHVLSTRVNVTQIVGEEFLEMFNTKAKNGLHALCLKSKIGWEVWRKDTTLAMRILIAHAAEKKKRMYKRALRAGAVTRSHPAWMIELYGFLPDVEEKSPPKMEPKKSPKTDDSSSPKSPNTDDSSLPMMESTPEDSLSLDALTKGRKSGVARFPHLDFSQTVPDSDEELFGNLESHEDESEDEATEMEDAESELENVEDAESEPEDVEDLILVSWTGPVREEPRGEEEIAEPQVEAK